MIEWVIHLIWIPEGPVLLGETKIETVLFKALGMFLIEDVHVRRKSLNKCVETMSEQKSFVLQWNLVIKRSDIIKPSYNKVILLVPALYISLFFYPDIMRNLI